MNVPQESMPNDKYKSVKRWRTTSIMPTLELSDVVTVTSVCRSKCIINKYAVLLHFVNFNL